jgi:hypothetical protein
MIKVLLNICLESDNKIEFFLSFSNLSADQQANNAFYQCIDSAPDIPDAKAVPLGLDMVYKRNKILIYFLIILFRVYPWLNDQWVFQVLLEDKI